MGSWNKTEVDGRKILSETTLLKEVMQINEQLDPKPEPPKRKRGRPKKENPAPAKPYLKKGELPPAIVAALKCTKADIPEMFADVTENVIRKRERIGNQLSVSDRNIIRRTVLDGVRLGRDHHSIADEVEALGFSRSAASRYIQLVTKALDEEYHQYVKNVAQTNTIAIQGLLQRALDSNDTKTALACIQELNRMSGLYSDNKLTVKSDGPVTISFGGETLDMDPEDSNQDLNDAGIKIIEK